jgi:hypothetical protein
MRDHHSLAHSSRNERSDCLIFSKAKRQVKIRHLRASKRPPETPTVARAPYIEAMDLYLRLWQCGAPSIQRAIAAADHLDRVFSLVHLSDAFEQ